MTEWFADYEKSRAAWVVRARTPSTGTVGVCEVYGHGPTAQESAELIASAPRLQEAVERLHKEKQSLALDYLAEQGQWIEETGKLRDEIERLDTLLRQRFARSSPIEEQLQLAGVGKRPLPTQEECLAWAAKLGVPDEYRRNQK